MYVTHTNFSSLLLYMESVTYKWNEKSKQFVQSEGNKKRVSHLLIVVGITMKCIYFLSRRELLIKLKLIIQ